MTPLSLTLKGFRGIRDGLGRDELTLDLELLGPGSELVALAGMNGRGKTTIIDNMHPYLTMPSRASVAGPGGFSYYEHVCLAENEKDLVWQHNGERYRSHVIVRLNGKRRTEAFLFVCVASGWKPFRLEDGTISDGKVETYERCVEAICGSAETFFTSVFSAQGKRQLTAYKNAEIKTLLADLLGLEEIRTLGQRGSETAKLLKAGLMTIRQERAALDEELRRARSQCATYAGAESRLKQADDARREAQRALNMTRASHARLAAERDQAQGIEARRTELADERQRIVEAGIQAKRALDAQDEREQRRLREVEEAVRVRAEKLATRRRALETKRQQALTSLRCSTAVAWADRRQALAQGVVAARAKRVAQSRKILEQLTAVQANEKSALQRHDAIEREAAQAALRAADLARRFHLTKEVPCVGTDLQGRCKLLADANEAKTLIPSADLQVERLAREKLAIARELRELRARIAALNHAPIGLASAERRLDRARERGARLALLAARTAEIAQAHAALADIEHELSTLEGGSAETEEDRSQRQQITTAREAIANERARQAASEHDAVTRVERAVAALPVRYDQRRLAEADRAVQQAELAAAAAEKSLSAAVADAQALKSASQQVLALTDRMARVSAHAANVEAELGRWLLFAKCLSNDGLIALAIDDAGPALAGLANDLLLACYGPRFTVSIKTLTETGRGDQREGFDVVVHDAESGESKSVALMSGGERVWINECLVRAIALYLAQHSGRRYTTLFSDEADGALDLERKRMFMQMKREVLRLGGYEREFFVSQTPELTAMADIVIDLDRLAVNANKGGGVVIEVPRP